jgi:hypothetical protein
LFELAGAFSPQVALNITGGGTLKVIGSFIPGVPLTLQDGRIDVLGNVTLDVPLTLGGTGVVTVSSTLTSSLPLTVDGGGTLAGGMIVAPALSIHGGTLVGGKIVAPSISVLNGGMVRALDPSVDKVHKLELEIAGTLLVDASSKIDVTGKGYLARRTTGNTTVGGAAFDSGGSYGGRGSGSGTNAVYGDYADPDDWGAGGGVGPGGGGTGAD